MTVITINLLPHRELKRAQRRRDFYVLSGLFAGAGAAIVLLVGAIISGYVAVQQSRNEFIKQENAALDKQIAEVAQLKQEIDALRERQQAVENLQTDRNIPVYLFTELVNQVPEGIYLRSFKQEGLKVTLTGLAQSNERVSELLRNLANNSSYIEKPNLIEIKVSQQQSRRGSRLFDFSLDMLLKRPVVEAPEKPGAAKKRSVPVTPAAQ
ncbi:PilN domain-containing protein [Derxia gummosa]|uniref:PilN domain-containing protein n=1 Tax=Derxia gummosa DSM 723 TaxID=1121388 RepID=A0A8B6X6Y7_9BURK|nr:PilN domain-containing protein [Derxia gummosa]